MLLISELLPKRIRALGFALFIALVWQSLAVLLNISLRNHRVAG